MAPLPGSMRAESGMGYRRRAISWVLGWPSIRWYSGMWMVASAAGNSDLVDAPPAGAAGGA